MTQHHNPAQNISITVRQNIKVRKCIFCEPGNIEQQQQKHYDIEIHTKTKNMTTALALLLVSRSEATGCTYALTQINVQLCEIHYGNFKESLPLNQELWVDFNEFKKIFCQKATV